MSSAEELKNKEAKDELETAILKALVMYSNVHRGSGHKSMVSTHLYEKSRDMILDYLGLSSKKYMVVFCSPYRVTVYEEHYKNGIYKMVSSHDIGLSIGVRALVVNRNLFKRKLPLHPGGGAAKLISTDWIIWADGPDRFEAGTPAIINAICFAKALVVLKKYGLTRFATTELKTDVNDLLYADEFQDEEGYKLLEKVRDSIIGHRVLVPTANGKNPYINFDHSASTPAFGPVWDVFRKSLYLADKEKTDVLNEVRRLCVSFVGATANEYELVFTSNTTESVNVLADSLTETDYDNIEPVILSSILEHSSNDLPWRNVPNHSIIRIDSNFEGFFDIDELKSKLHEYNQDKLYGNKRIKLISVTGASNIYGSCNDIKAISNLAKEYGVKVAIDGAQIVAHLKTDMTEMGIDYLYFSAHKMYAPFGAGVLVARKGLLDFTRQKMSALNSMGEENVSGIAALGKSIDLFNRIEMDNINKEEKELTVNAIHGLREIKGVKLHGVTDTSSPDFKNRLGILLFEVKNKMPARASRFLAYESGIGVRWGCHCAHLAVKKLVKIGKGIEKVQWLFQILFPKQRLQGLIRVSFGIENKPDDIQELLHSIRKYTDQTDNNTKTQESVKKQVFKFKSEFDDYIITQVNEVFK